VIGIKANKNVNGVFSGIGVRLSSRSVSTVLAIAVTLLGLTVMMGWFFQNHSLVQIHHSFSPMQFNAALCFSLSGIALLASLHHWPTIASVLATLITLIASLTSIEYLGGVSLGVDELLVQAFVTATGAHPGRMALNSALSFLITGIVLLLGNLNSHFSVLSRAAALVSGLGLLGLYGNIIEVDPAYGWGQMTRMALHSAIGFILLGLAIALWGSKLEQGNGRTGDESYWNMQTAHISIYLLVAVLALWQTMSTLEDKNVRQSIEYRLARLQGSFLQEITSQQEAQERMANRWQARQEGTPRQEWEDDAHYYIEHSIYLHSVLWVDPAFVVHWRVPRAAGDEIPALTVQVLGKSRVDEAVTQRHAVLSELMALSGATSGFAIIQPVFDEQKLSGFILAVLRLEELMTLLVKDVDLVRHGRLQLFSTQGDIWRIGSSNNLLPRYGGEVMLALGHPRVRAIFTPTAEYVAERRSMLPGFILGGGLLLILSLQYFYLLHRRDRHKTQMLESEMAKRLETEEAIKKYTSELERSNRELNDFAYVTSHDLKAPLRGIMQLTNWIEEDLADKLDGSTRDYFHLLKNRVARLEKLLDDLLAYSRVGRKHGDIRQVDIKALVEELIVLLNPRPGISVVCETGLPVFNTLAVPLEQVLRNLIDNAIKHHDKPEGVITVSARGRGGEVEFTVADDGPGIAPEHQERVFGIFQTLKPRDEVEGSGMGLAIVKKLVENYRGKIWLESDGKLGTSISFTWPKEHRIRKIIND
jgi:signal transduction histidine kinase